MNKIRVLISLAVPFLFLWGCNPQYKAEKMYWHAQKKYSAVMDDPAAASEARFNAAVKELVRIIEENSAWDDAANIQLEIARMYALRKQFGTAEAEYLKVPAIFPDNPEVCARALFSLGVMHEGNNEQKKAIDVLNRVSNEYPLTVTGLKTPLYIARYYRKHDNARNSEEAYGLALRRYESIVATYPAATQIPLVLKLITDVAADRYEWDEALSIIHKLVQAAPQSPHAPGALYRMAVIYQKELRDSQKASSLCAKFLDAYPEDALADTVQGLMESLTDKETQQRME